VEWIFNLPVGL